MTWMPKWWDLGLLLRRTNGGKTPTFSLQCIGFLDLIQETRFLWTKPWFYFRCHHHWWTLGLCPVISTSLQYYQIKLDFGGPKMIWVFKKTMENPFVKKTARCRPWDIPLHTGSQILSPKYAMDAWMVRLGTSVESWVENVFCMKQWTSDSNEYKPYYNALRIKGWDLPTQVGLGTPCGPALWHCLEPLDPTWKCRKPPP